MKLTVILILSFPLFSLMNTCCHVSIFQSNTEKLLGIWKTADSTSFRGKEIEFSPDHQVILILTDGSEQNGQYEITGNVITFSIGDAPPFKMNFRFENDVLYLTFPDTQAETHYSQLESRHRLQKQACQLLLQHQQ